MLGGLPFLVFLTAYNYHYFSHPLAFGQSVAASAIALSKTGFADLWQTSWWESLPGLLLARHGVWSGSRLSWCSAWRHEQASLWRWDRPQIGYHLAHFSSERARKKQGMATYLNYPGPILNVPNRNQNTAP